MTKQAKQVELVIGKLNKSIPCGDEVRASDFDNFNLEAITAQAQQEAVDGELRLEQTITSPRVIQKGEKITVTVIKFNGQLLAQLTFGGSAKPWSGNLETIKEQEQS